MTEEQFRRCLDMMAVGSLYNLYYSESELSLLLLMYKDKVFPERVKWKNFVDEINTGIMKSVERSLLLLLFIRNYLRTGHQ